MPRLVWAAFYADDSVDAFVGRAVLSDSYGAVYILLFSRPSLKLHFSSESDDKRALHATSNVRVILDDRLQEEHRRDV
jgi:hypothetical protein